MYTIDQSPNDYIDWYAYFRTSKGFRTFGFKAVHNQYSAWCSVNNYNLCPTIIKRKIVYLYITICWGFLFTTLLIIRVYKCFTYQIKGGIPVYINMPEDSALYRLGTVSDSGLTYIINTKDHQVYFAFINLCKKQRIPIAI